MYVLLRLESKSTVESLYTSVNISKRKEAISIIRIAQVSKERDPKLQRKVYACELKGRYMKENQHQKTEKKFLVLYQTSQTITKRLLTIRKSLVGC